jgi:hypothetical protein
MEEVEKALQALETIHLQYLPVSRVLQAMALGPSKDSAYYLTFVHLPRKAQRLGRKFVAEGVDLGTLTERVLQEAWKRMGGALGVFWETLGIHPRTEIEEALREGYWLKARYYRFSRWRPARVQAEITGRAGTFYHEVPNRQYPEFSLEAWGGRIEVSTPFGLFVRQNRAFLRTSSLKEVKEALGWAKSLRPFLSILGLEDLERALLALARLGDGDARMEGPYLLARRDNLWVLRRGLFLGNPALDGAFLTGQGVGLFYPEGLGITFRGEFVGNHIGLRDLKIWWRWEAARIGGALGWSWNFLDDDFLGDLIWRTLAWNRGVLDAKEHSIKLRAFIESLRESLDEGEDLLAVLNGDRLHSKIVSHLFSWL